MSFLPKNKFESPCKNLLSVQLNQLFPIECYQYRHIWLQVTYFYIVYTLFIKKTIFTFKWIVEKKQSTRRALIKWQTLNVFTFGINTWPKCRPAKTFLIGNKLTHYHYMIIVNRSWKEHRLSVFAIADCIVERNCFSWTNACITKELLVSKIKQAHMHLNFINSTVLISKLLNQ